MDNKYSLIITTCADKESARAAARLLVGKRLAACVQIFPIESVYVWRGGICDDKELVLFIKSKSGLFDEIAAAVRECHSYEIPEIIQVPITDGLPEYLRWIDEAVSGGE